MTTNQLAYLNYLENSRHNAAVEQETHRSNVVMQGLERERVGETARHNLASEFYSMSALAETQRSNLVRETETERSNLAREAETERSNLAREQLTREAQDEAARHNLAVEDVNKSVNFANWTKGITNITDSVSKTVNVAEKIASWISKAGLGSQLSFQF